MKNKSCWWALGPVLVLALVFFASFDVGAQTRHLSIATGTTGGVYYPVGGAIAEILNRQVSGIQAVAEATGASVENMRLLLSGESDVALVQGDVAYDAYHGVGRFERQPIQSYVITVAYPNVYHAVTLQSVHERLGLNCYADFRGTRFSVGAPGSGNETTTQQAFASLGIQFSDLRVQRYAYSETARALREGQLDGGSWVVGLGHGTLLELETTHPIHLVPFCDHELEAILSAYPYYTRFVIPGGTYATVPHDVQTFALWNVIVVSPDFPEDMAYTLAKAIYENVDFLAQVYPPGAPFFTVENLANSPIPVHPGVIRYAAEQGFAVPEALVP